MANKSPKIQLLDGGFSSQILCHLNIEERECNNHPLWCTRFLAQNPEAVINTHRDFIKAGSDIIITNSYQASIEGFQKYLELSPTESFELIQNSVHFAKEAIKAENKERLAANKPEQKVYVAGSVGSYGACLHDGSEYRGDYIKNVTSEFLKDWHRSRMDALVSAGVDFLAIETIPALMEAKVLLDLLKEYPNQKAWISFTCKDGQSNVFGDDIEVAAKALWSQNTGQLVAIGVNCLHPSLVTALITSIRNSNKTEPIPTIAYPNNGEKYDDDLKQWVRMNGHLPLEQYIVEWVNADISIIGGCCKTTAVDIKMFRDYIDNHQEAQKLSSK